MSVLASPLNYWQLSYRLGVDFVLLGMGTYETDEDHSSVIVYLDDEPIAALSEPEDCAIIANCAGSGISCREILRSGPVFLFDFLVPGFQWFLGIGIVLPEFSQCSFGDNPHLGRRTSQRQTDKGTSNRAFLSSQNIIFEVLCQDNLFENGLRRERAALARSTGT